MFLMLLITLTPFQADKVEIFTEDNERIVHLIGNVIIEGGETRITCSDAKISEIHGWVKLFQNVVLQDRNGVVSAVSAIYYFNEDRGYLKDSVKIVTADEEISADSLYYDGVHDSVEMYGNVVITDVRNDMSVSGDRGWYNLARDEGLLVGNPKLEVMRQDKSPIVVYANTFELLTRQDLFYGYDSVQAIIDSITVMCDTFSYNLNSETGRMVRPAIREKNNELTGAYGQFRLTNREIEVMSVEQGNSLYYTKEGSQNIVKGDTISITFQQGQARMIRVEGKPRGILSLKRSEESAGDQGSD
jgi:lipopolysaccharide export system protein LptA